MTWIIIIIGAIISFFIYNSYKGIKDLKYVEKSGGLEIKYQEFIDFILSNEKLRLKQINSNNIEIGYSFIGNGHVKFKLTEMSKNLMVRYQSKDNVDGIQNLAWKFNENEPQSEMIEKISKDLFVHTQQLSGLSKNEALRAYSELSEKREELRKELEYEMKGNSLKTQNNEYFRNCLGMFLELYNELTEVIRKRINDDGLLTEQDKYLLNNDVETGNLNLIKNRFVLLNSQGKFNKIIDDYLVNESDIDAICHSIMLITMEDLGIDENLFLNYSVLASKETIFLSFLKFKTENQIKIKLFQLNSVEEFEREINNLISMSKTNFPLYIH